ncbi:uncharacterized protein LOC142165725 [Nicotiana tabacum]|uniref:Uncharacterized protein LOC142165725 n=1 Tax=Nicotiana tabacum TaxID=4097 RepID=A0AC58S5D1_TOBAC
MDEQGNQPPRPTTGTTRNVIDNAGDDALTAILKRMEKMEIEIRNSLCFGETQTESKVAAKDKVNLSTKKCDALCEFHQERGHKIKDSIALRQEVVNLLRQGHLKELLSHTGRTNFTRGHEQHQGPQKTPSHDPHDLGNSNYSSVNSVKFTTTHKLKHSITRKQYDRLEESIVFDKSDTKDLTFHHNDALVITLRILDTDVRCIMVDNGSGACIIHLQVLAQMKLEVKIVPHCITLTSFNNAVERTSGEITLLVLDDGVTMETIFHIMDQDTTYNAIVGRLWIHTMRVVPSSSCKVIKLPTMCGIFSI